MLTGLHIEWIDGNCPVQAEGTIGPHAWYFRARGRGWSFHVMKWGPEPFDRGFSCSGEWGDDEFGAGYMPLDVARGFIEQSARAFLRQQG